MKRPEREWERQISLRERGRWWARLRKRCLDPRAQLPAPHLPRTQPPSNPSSTALQQPMTPTPLLATESARRVSRQMWSPVETTWRQGYPERLPCGKAPPRRDCKVAPKSGVGSPSTAEAGPWGAISLQKGMSHDVTGTSKTARKRGSRILARILLPLWRSAIVLSETVHRLHSCTMAVDYDFQIFYYDVFQLEQICSNSVQLAPIRTTWLHLAPIGTRQQPRRKIRKINH